MARTGSRDSSGVPPASSRGEEGLQTAFAVPLAELESDTAVCRII